MAEPIDSANWVAAIDALKTIALVVIPAGITALSAWAIHRSSQKTTIEVSQDNNRTALELADQAHRHTTSQKYNDERRALILETGRLIVDAQTICTSSASDLAYSADDEKRFETATNNMRVGYQKFDQAFANLEILGETEASDAVLDMHETLNDIGKLAGEGTAAFEKGSDDLHGQLGERSKIANRALARAFRRTD